MLQYLHKRYKRKIFSVRVCVRNAYSKNPVSMIGPDAYVCFHIGAGLSKHRKISD